MKKGVFVSIILAWTLNVLGQALETQWALVDADRNDRQVPCMVWYPSNSSGPYPTVIFAHGFFLAPDDYEGLAEAIVSEGYVFASIATEQGFVVDHEAYGQDLAFVAEEITTDGVGGILDGALDGRIAIGGHSMGGGASWLSAESNPPVDAFFALAPAETNPSAVAAGELIEAPAMVISGTNDFVTLPATQHEPIYESVENSICSAFISILEGGHCGYADPGTLCDLGEIGFQGLSHDEQLALSLSVLVPWLDAFLKDDPAALETLDLAGESLELELNLLCGLDLMEGVLDHGGIEIFYRDPPYGLTLWNKTNNQAQATLWSVYGRRVVQHTFGINEKWTPVGLSGVYVVIAGGSAARMILIR